MAQGFIARVNGRFKQILGLTSSAGAADAGKIVALGDDGRLDMSMMPAGVGSQVTVVAASEALGAGKFVNLWSDAGTLKARLADRSNDRPAHGYVKAAVASGANAAVFSLEGVNSGLSALTPGNRYYLATAGSVDANPPLEDDAGNAGVLSQYVGIAKSATELLVEEDDAVVL